MTAPLLEARNLHRTGDGETPLLTDVSLRVDPGQRWAIRGSSGAGKTVLMRALALLDPIDAGEIHFHGKPVANTDVPRYRSRVVYLQQRPTLLEGTVEENLQLPFQLRAHDEHQYDRDRIIELLSHVGRDESFLTRQREHLSGGEAQIVAVLRAIQLNPQLLLLDEPTAALDADSVHAVESLVTDWLAEDNTRATVWVTHDDAQTQRMSDHVLHLAGGRVVKKP
ncbi:ATP-binding cassette domain-containing protein [Maioricimonas sp. JC845]|uniref:ABC transporter ATP-binding protein n=1 Tax=Maioricimonas sp. JC845 TaxID=3232138 RepID=UPI003459CEB8